VPNRKNKRLETACKVSTAKKVIGNTLQSLRAEKSGLETQDVAGCLCAEALALRLFSLPAGRYVGKNQ